MGRGIFYIMTMTGIVITIGIVTNIVCALLGIELDSQSLGSLILLSAGMGFLGSAIGLFTSKMMVKKQMKVELIETPSTQTEKWLVNTVALLAEKKGVKMPEVGIYRANEMNAFATGWNKDAALVAVSTGLLDSMSQEEIEAVLGHEMSHVSNGDMVTMCLVQGAVNTIAYLASFLISSAVKKRGSDYLLRQGCMMVFGFLGNIVVMAFSRWREYRADAGSAKVLGKEAMIHALEALKHQTVEPKPDGVKALCISGMGAFSELFMTHPPLDKRIDALRKLSD